jgi:hypothetical protein
LVSIFSIRWIPAFCSSKSTGIRSTIYWVIWCIQLKAIWPCMDASSQ